jgi:hypothetical protein
MMGARAVTPAAAAGRPPTNTQSSKSARRRSNPLQGAISLNNTTNFNVEGSYFVKQTGMFVGWYWKERWLSLKGASLIIHTRKTKVSRPISGSHIVVLTRLSWSYPLLCVHTGISTCKGNPLVHHHKCRT